MSEFDGDNVRELHMKKNKYRNEDALISEWTEMINPPRIQEIKLEDLYYKWVTLLYHEDIYKLKYYF